MRTLYVAIGRTTEPPLRISIPILADTEKAAWTVADALRPNIENWRVEPADQISAWERVSAFEYARTYNEGNPYDADLLIADATRWFRKQVDAARDVSPAPGGVPLLGGMWGSSATVEARLELE